MTPDEAQARRMKLLEQIEFGEAEAARLHDEIERAQRELELLAPYWGPGITKIQAVAAYYRDHPEAQGAAAFWRDYPEGKD